MKHLHLSFLVFPAVVQERQGLQCYPRWALKSMFCRNGNDDYAAMMALTICLSVSFFSYVCLQRMSCSYLLCTILLFVAVLLAVTVTGTILLMNHYQAPPMSDGPPHISTNQDEANALVTVERGDGSRINIFIDPNCPDYNSNFLRLEGVQTSLLHSLTDHDTDLKSVKGQDRALLVNLAEEVAKLSAHAGQLKMDYESLRRGQSNLGQDLNTLQTEQSRLIQVMAYRCTHMQNSCICRGRYMWVVDIAWPSF